MKRRVLELFDRCCVLGVSAIGTDATLTRATPAEWRQAAELLHSAGEVERAEALSRLWSTCCSSGVDPVATVEVEPGTSPSTGVSLRRRSLAAVQSPVEQLVEQSRAQGQWRAAVSTLLESSPTQWSPRMLRDAVVASSEGSTDWRIACLLVSQAPSLPLDDVSLRCILRTVRRSAQWSIGFAVLKRYEDHHQQPSSRAYSDLCWSAYVHAPWEVALRTAASVALPSFYVGMAQVGSLIRGARWSDALVHMQTVVPSLPGATQPFPSAVVILFVCLTAFKVDPTGADCQRFLEHFTSGLLVGSEAHAAVVAAALCCSPGMSDGDPTATIFHLDCVPLRRLLRCAAAVCTLMRSSAYPSLSHVSGLLKDATCRCSSAVSYRLGRAAAASTLSAAAEAELLVCVGEAADTTAFFQGFLLTPSVRRTTSKR